MLADSLPDRWGTALVNAWLASQGREESSFDVVQRLCYVGTRGMGALKFQPAREPTGAEGSDLPFDALVRLATEVLAQRERFVAELSEDPEEDAIKAILSIGTSAGGARPKAIIAYNDATGQVRSGQVDVGEGFTHWLLKFDGVSRAGDHGLTDPQGWCAIEYAYSIMARAAGVEMSECRLLRGAWPPALHDPALRPHGRRWQAAHADARRTRARRATTSPARIATSRRCCFCGAALGTASVEQLFRRMVFNVVARNQDDHVKNIAFLMDRTGAWSLAPAYDLTWAWQPGNAWLDSHQMTLNGKRDSFSRRRPERRGPSRRPQARPRRRHSRRGLRGGCGLARDRERHRAGAADERADRALAPSRSAPGLKPATRRLAQW